MTARLTVGTVAWASVLVIVSVLAAFGAGGQSVRAGVVLTPTVTSTSTPTATAVPADTPTSTATPTSVAQAPAGLPPTGSGLQTGSGFPWAPAAAALASGGLALVAGGVVLWKRPR